MEIPPLGSDVTEGASTRAQSFCIPTTYECKKFNKQILFLMVWFECSHHIMVSPSLNLH